MGAKEFNPRRTIAIYGNAGAGKDFLASYIRLLYDVMHVYKHPDKLDEIYSSEHYKWMYAFFDDNLFEDKPEEIDEDRFMELMDALCVHMHLPLHRNGDLNEEKTQVGSDIGGFTIYDFGREGAEHVDLPISMRKFYFAYALKKQLADSIGATVNDMNNQDFKANALYDLKKCRLYDARLDELTYLQRISKVFSAEEYDIYMHDYNRFCALNPDYEDIEKHDFVMTIREMLVYYGTYVMRRHLNDSIWLNKTLFSKEFESSEYRIITDMRFPNEYKKLREIGAYIIKVVNPDSDGKKVDNIAESYYDSFEPDYVMESSRDFRTFRENLYKLLSDMGLF